LKHCGYYIYQLLLHPKALYSTHIRNIFTVFTTLTTNRIYFSALNCGSLCF